MSEEFPLPKKFKLEKIISRCCICQAIERDGKLIPRALYTPQKLESQGYWFSDTILSEECRQKSLRDVDDPKVPEQIKYDKCPR